MFGLVDFCVCCLVEFFGLVRVNFVDFVVLRGGLIVLL